LVGISVSLEVTILAGLDPVLGAVSAAVLSVISVVILSGILVHVVEAVVAFVETHTSCFKMLELEVLK